MLYCLMPNIHSLANSVSPNFYLLFIFLSRSLLSNFKQFAASPWSICPCFTSEESIKIEVLSPAHQFAVMHSTENMNTPDRMVSSGTLNTALWLVPLIGAIYLSENGGILLATHKFTVMHSTENIRESDRMVGSGILNTALWLAVGSYLSINKLMYPIGQAQFANNNQIWNCPGLH